MVFLLCAPGDVAKRLKSLLLRIPLCGLACLEYLFPHLRDIFPLITYLPSFVDTQIETIGETACEMAEC